MTWSFVFVVFPLVPPPSAQLVAEYLHPVSSPCILLLFSHLSSLPLSASNIRSASLRLLSIYCVDIRNYVRCGEYSSEQSRQKPSVLVGWEVSALCDTLDVVLQMRAGEVTLLSVILHFMDFRDRRCLSKADTVTRTLQHCGRSRMQ